MATQKNTLDSIKHHAHEKKSTLAHQREVDLAASHFINLYNARATFFADLFIKKVKEGNRKALSELQRHPMPPTQMDLRQAFAACLKANISDDYSFSMKDGKVYLMQELRQLVPEWASVAERALMESDPALADKLMSLAQWNAKSAFEVTFVSAINELKTIKKAKQVSGSLDHYMKWIIAPLEKAIEQVEKVNPPRNSLIGYGDRISLSEALETAESLKEEFQKLIEDNS